MTIIGWQVKNGKVKDIFGWKRYFAYDTKSTPTHPLISWLEPNIEFFWIL
jgi:hypothetical protein